MQATFLLFWWIWMDYRMVHGKTTYEWHTDDMRVHTSDIRVTYEYIRVTYEYIRVAYGWHTSTYEWHTDNIRVNTSYIQMAWCTNAIRVSYGCNAVRKKNKVIFFKAFWRLSFKMFDLQKNSLHAMTVLGSLIKLERGLEFTFGAHFLHGFFHTNAP